MLGGEDEKDNRLECDVELQTHREQSKGVGYANTQALFLLLLLKPFPIALSYYIANKQPSSSLFSSSTPPLPPPLPLFRSHVPVAAAACILNDDPAAIAAGRLVTAAVAMCKEGARKACASGANKQRLPRRRSTRAFIIVVVVVIISRVLPCLDGRSGALVCRCSCLRLGRLARAPGLPSPPSCRCSSSDSGNGEWL